MPGTHIGQLGIIHLHIGATMLMPDSIGYTQKFDAATFACSAVVTAVCICILADLAL